MNTKDHKPGQIFECNVPYADGANPNGITEKPRPVLLITAPDVLGDVVVLPITGSGHHPNTIALQSADMAKGTMKKSSYVRVRKPLTVNLSILGATFGDLSSTGLQRIKREMCVALEGC